MNKYIKITAIVLTCSIVLVSCNKSSIQKENIQDTDTNKTVITTAIQKKETNLKKQISLKEEKKIEKLIETSKSKIIKEETALAPVSYPKQILNRKSTKEQFGYFDFDIIKKGFMDDNTLLIVGGIQGDEPGGFMAASLIATHYKILKGSVWVVPNLNFYSIIKRSRGPHGDMNRKFAGLSVNDPDYESVERIKKHITSDNVKLIVNLHDGSGFYRPVYEDKLHAPNRWGQCTIIDQAKIESKNYSDLESISKQVVEHVNKFSLKKEHNYHPHNTRTSEGDKEMEKTLTYFAINQGKAAFGNEASKSLPTHQRVYYHLLALEKFMKIMGIEYERKFNLNDQVVKNILDNDIEISLYDDKIKLPLAQIRNYLNYFPVKEDGTIDFVPSNPLMSIVKTKDEYTIYYGNRRLSKLKPDFTKHIDCEKSAKLKVDRNDIELDFGKTIKIKESFLVYPLKDYKINVVGYADKTKIDTGVNITYPKMLKRFSIDKEGKRYRVEYYSKNKFAGMIIVEFDGSKS
ncbi:MAG: M99 family carboxypeptidase catalytic domain-containing protein [Campylobacterota bacterium]|nr:M99 family carboxypeptidase catalytic domain-containing protein [Campylobacterota bacterium]